MNGKTVTFLKTLGGADKKIKALWNNLTTIEKDKVRQVFKKNPKFAGHGLPAILEAIKDFK